MKKILILVSALAITLFFAACGTASTDSSGTDTSSSQTSSVNMVTVSTAIGVNASLPDSLTTTNNVTYANSNTGENVTFTSSDATASSISDLTQDSLLAMYQIKYPDAKITSFDNTKQVDGKASVQAAIDLTTPNGSAVTMNVVMFADDTKNYSVAFIHAQNDTTGVVAQNLQTIIDSLTIAG